MGIAADRWFDRGAERHREQDDWFEEFLWEGREVERMLRMILDPGDTTRQDPSHTPTPFRITIRVP